MNTQFLATEQRYCVIITPVVVGPRDVEQAYNVIATSPWVATRIAYMEYQNDGGICDRDELIITIA